MMFPVVKAILKRVKLQWKLSLLVLLFLPLLVRLGYWQLDRAVDKEQLLAVYQQQQNLPAENFEQLILEQHSDIHYRPAILNGIYDQDRYWLLDNQPRQGKVGYEVIMPLNVSGQWVLVNRGWVQASRLRSELPIFDTPSGRVVLQGYFHIPSKNAVMSQTNSDLTQEWPKRVIELNVAKIEQALGDAVYSKVLRIDSDNPGALITDWPMINTSPEKHYGYAMQWFLMALALVFLYAWAIVKTDRHNDRKITIKDNN